MKYIFVLSIFIGGTIFINSCSSKKTISVSEIKFKLTDKFFFTLDSVTTNDPESIQFFEDKNSKHTFLILFDEKSLNIDLYDYNSKKLARRISLEIDGPEGINSKSAIHGMYFHNPDSIFVANDYFINLINSKGSVFKRFKLLDPTKKLSGLPALNNNAVHIEKNKLYFPFWPDIDECKPASYTQALCMTELDLKTGNYSYFLPYPDGYRNGSFGPNYGYPFPVFNASSRSFVVSFPASPALVSYNIDTKQTTIEKKTATSLFQDIEAMDKPCDSYDNYTRFYVQNPSYEDLLYDKKNKLYYRVALKGRNDDDYNKGEFWKKGNIVILDANFNTLGEFVKDETYSNFNYLCHDGKIILLKKGEAENEIHFHAFEIDKTK